MVSSRSCSVIGPRKCRRTMPLPSISVGLGHARQAPVEAGLAVEVEAGQREGIAQLGQPGAASSGLFFQAMPMMVAPSRSASRVNSGCSARQGVHQLAKKLTSIGLPVSAARR